MQCADKLNFLKLTRHPYTIADKTSALGQAKLNHHFQRCLTGKNVLQRADAIYGIGGERSPIDLETLNLFR